MTNQLEVLEDWAAGLIGQLEPASRNKLARRIGQELRRSQQQRIIAQQNPDGSKYAPRKQRGLRGKQGRVKRKVKMFQKLRTAKFLRLKVDEKAIGLGFTGRIARISRVHQYGLIDRAEKGAAEVNYQRREILGFATTDVELIRNQLLYFLTNQQ